MTQQQPAKKFVIIDGKSVFYRGYYAMPGLSNKDGLPTGGVYGFATMALEVIRRLEPDYVAVAWDKPKTNIRKRLALYPAYKAGRKPAPPDFYAQIPILHRLLEAFGWPLYELDDYEADDIMGTLAVQATAKGIETYIITSDMDMLQIVNDHVHVYALKTGLTNIELYSPESFQAKYGIRVDQFLDLKALQGDSSDNIPGVPGIGQKGAKDLLTTYETLDGIYDNLALVKDSVRKKLEAGKDLAQVSKQLARIWTDAPVNLHLHEVDGSQLNGKQIVQLFKELEFSSLLRHLPPVLQAAVSDEQHLTGELFAAKALPLKVVTSEKALQDVAQSHVAATEVYIYSRAAGSQGTKPEVLVLSYDAKECFALDLRVLPKRVVATFLGSLPKLIGYDLKYSYKLLIEYGLEELPLVCHDVFIGAFLLNSLRREQTLSELAMSDLGYGGSAFEPIDSDELIGRSTDVMQVINRLYTRQTAQLKKLPELAHLAKTIEWPVIPVLARMEYVGIELDTAYLSSFASEIDTMIASIAQEIYGYAQKSFNIGSPAQLAEVLFDTLKLPTTGIKKGKTGYSTGVSELDKLRGSHPIIDLVTRYREVAKLKNTYVDTLPKQVDSNSRVHTTFNLTIAQTGRLSSTDPNLQNIPIRTELGKRIRTAFVAGPGKMLISADYSQFELRLAAVLAQDHELIEMFNRGADIHTLTAAQVYGREPEDVTKQMRRAAKVINFGILYGMSPHGLMIATGMTRDQASGFIDRYKALRKPLFDYMEKVREQARTDGYVETLFGRRRPMPDIHSANFVIRQAAERAAINMPIQGTEADLMKMAMVQAAAVIKTSYKNAELLLQIHDSIVVEAPAAQTTDLAQQLKQTMESVYKLPVRLDVDVTSGDNWGLL